MALIDEMVDGMLGRTQLLDAQAEMMLPRLALARDVPGATPRRRCSMPNCNERFKRTDAVFVVRGQGTKEVTETIVHRRCVEGMFRLGVVDEQDAIDEFEGYRSGILERLA